MNKSGFYLVNKPPGITSSDLVLRIKKTLHIDKIGHTGTLDKAAEGLLILPVGSATCFADLFLHGEKGYNTEVQFGKSTDSGDREGEVIEEWSVERVHEFFVEKKELLENEIKLIPETKTQVPPKISALKVGGRRQSDLFRSGKEFESKERKISISKFRFSDLNESGFKMSLLVSGGTYIRKIVIDLSEKTGLPMHMSRLIRTSLGVYSLEKAYSLEDILSGKFEPTPILEVIKLPLLKVGEKEKDSILHGRYPALNQKPVEDFFFVDSAGSILAWGSPHGAKPENSYRYLKVFHNSNEN